MARELFSKSFWADAIERAVKTAAQTILTGLVLSTSGPVNAFELDATLTWQLAASGAVFSVLTSIVSAPIGAANSASVLPATALPPPVVGQPAPDPPAGG